MKREVEALLAEQGVAFAELPLSLRVLLVTDGTVTELLEAILGERMKLGFHAQTLDYLQLAGSVELSPGAEQMAGPDGHCLRRAITLQGETSGQQWLYAESLIRHDLLSERARALLMAGDVPIGEVLSSEGIDNRREIVACAAAVSPHAADKLRLARDGKLLYRVYRVLSGERALFLITEWFAAQRIARACDEAGAGGLA